jgi:hypothetical protein
MGMSITRLFGAAAVMLALLFGTAHAEDVLVARLPKVTDPEARAHLVAGNASYRSGDFAKALDEFKAGLQKEDVAIFLYNIGQCYRVMKRYDDAIWVYRRFLDRAKPEPELAERVRGFIAEAEENKRRMPKEPTEPAGSDEPTKSSSVLIAPPPSVAPSPTVAPGLPASTAPQSEPRRIVHGEPWYADGAAWAVTGAGAIGLGVGGWLIVDAKNLDDDGNRTPKQSESVALHDRASTRRLGGAILGIAGAGALTLGVIMLIRHPSDHEESPTALHVGISPSSIAVFGRF